MGLLIDGVWHDEWYDTEKTQGRFLRKDSQFRNWVTPDGSPGISGKGGFKAEVGRYHLYISYACPWACRALIFRAIKGLEDIVSLSVVNWLMRENGWTFEPAEGVIPDTVNNVNFLHELYTKVEPNYTGRVTVPVLWDKQTGMIVNNESSEIIRMFNSAFDGVGATEGDYYPENLRSEIDAINDRIYNTVNNGVYKAGFATTQEAYEEGLYPLFESLDWLESILSKQRYLTGNTVTEADWRLFSTLIRFDAVYVAHFKCNIRELQDYPNLWAYTRELYQMPKIAETVDFKHIKYHYYQSQITINPSQVVPVGPKIDYNQPHNRDSM